MTHATLSPRNHRRRYHRALKHFESLEPRTLLSVTPMPYVIPDVWTGGAVYDSSGSLWVYDTDEPVTPVLQRIKDGVIDTAAGSVIPMDTSLYSPYAFAAGPNGHIYATNWDSSEVQAINDIDLATGTIIKTAIEVPGSPSNITVTGDGAVWFVLWDFYSAYPQHENVLGRMDPDTHAITTYTLDASLSDSQIGAICANGIDSVWITLGALDYQSESGQVFGTNRIATASVVGGAFTVTPYSMNTGTDADINGNITGMVSDRDGGVWFTLANVSYNTRPGSSPDAIVHGTFDEQGQFNQTAYVAPGTSVDTPRSYGFLSADNSGGVWFISIGTDQIGTFDGANWDFITNPTPTYQLGQTCSNGDGSQITIVTAPTVFDPDTGVPIGGVPLIALDFASAPITFQGEAYDVNIKEDTVLSGVLLATFVAPMPGTAYIATITWGDGTTTDVTPTAVGDNTYAIVITGKTFATQGSFAGSIAVKDGTTETGALTFTSIVSDTALNVSSFSARSLIFRIVAATGSFTDDADLSTSTWTATINWGDNTTTTGLIVRDPAQAGRYFVIALHQYRTRGTYTARLTVTTSETDATVLNSTLTTIVTVR